MSRVSLHWLVSCQPVFDVADEYTEALARQFAVLLGSAVFPLMTVLAAVVFAAE